MSYLTARRRGRKQLSGGIVGGGGGSCRLNTLPGVSKKGGGWRSGKTKSLFQRESERGFKYFIQGYFPDPERRERVAG